MTRKLMALVLTFLMGIALASILRKRPRHLLSRDLRALQLRMPEGCQYAPAMDLDYDIPPRIFCDHNLDGYDWQEIIGYAHGFFAPGTQWDLVLPEGVKHMVRPAEKDSARD
jgi:hypothetical protein